jgi:molybdopterin converting factor small subunit
MSQTIEIICYGSLREARSSAALTPDNRFPLSEATPLAAVIDLLEIPRGSIQLVMLNHRAVSKETVIKPGDRLALFPKEYPIFMDWNDYRL